MGVASRAVIVLVLSALAWQSPLPAQGLSGHVVDSVTGAPVGTGFVVLLDAEGRQVARTLSDADGRFTFPTVPSRGGPFRLRSERIGYRVAVSRAFEVPAGGLADFTLAVNALPVRLSEIEVRDETECKTDPSDDEQTAVVWDEVRKALAAASWTAAHQRYRYLSNLYERTLDARRRNVSDESFQRVSGVQRLPFISRDPEELERLGYIIEEQTLEYYAPDAQVLQDDRFLATHCFRLVRDRDAETELLGLAFEPVPSRRLPDVKGVLWLDEESAELRSLEYHYTNQPYDLRDERPGGTVEFLPVPSGAWIVHRWEIRAPLVTVKTNPRALVPELPEAAVTGFRDVGGEVMRITDASGTPVYEAELAEVAGTVWDSLAGAGRPLAGAVVRVAGSWFADTTDRDGRFHLAAPLDGEYRIAFTHPMVDSLGYTPPPRAVSLARGRIDTVALAVPTIEEIVDGFCPDGFRGPTHRILVGTVRDAATGAPVAGAQVLVTWQSISPEMRFDNHREERTTGEDGGYEVCGLERGRPVLVQALSPGRRSRLIRVSFEEAGVVVGAEMYYTERPVWRLDLTVRRRGR